MNLGILNEMKKVVTEQGVYAKKRRYTKFNTIWNSDKGLTTEIDLDISKSYKESLPRIVDVPVLSEEEYVPATQDDLKNYWLVDPIDGTLSFVNGFSGYVTQIALILEGEVKASAVYAPELDELYWALKDYGAFKNEVKLQSHCTSRLQIIIDNYPQPIPLIEDLMVTFGLNQYYELGSIGLKICQTASNFADLFVKLTDVYDWDVAPGKLILEESGGLLFDSKINPYVVGADIKKKGLLASSSLKVKSYEFQREFRTIVEKYNKSQEFKENE